VTPGALMRGAASARTISKRGARSRSRGGQGDPELEDARAARGLDGLVVDDAAAGRHPDEIAGRERALVAIVQRALEDQRHRLEAGVRVRAADLPARRDVEAIVHEQDERIAGRQVGGRHHLDGRVALADEAGRGRRRRFDARERTWHGSAEVSAPERPGPALDASGRVRTAAAEQSRRATVYTGSLQQEVRCHRGRGFVQLSCSRPWPP